MCHAVVGGSQQPRGGETVVHAQPLEGVADMVRNGVVRQAQTPADFLAAEVLIHQPQDLTLTLGQPPELVVPMVVIAVHANCSPPVPTLRVTVPQGSFGVPHYPWL
jgi:hypothetical protein